MNDLSKYDQPISSLFNQPKTPEEWDNYRLTDEQVAHFHEFGYVSNVKLLDDYQIERLKVEMGELMNPAHPAHSLFYEFHSNESSDSDSVLFHSLGHWRISEAFHDALWNPAFVMAAHQLLANTPFVFGMTNCFANQPIMAVS